MNIVITGASRGIGYELVRLFATNVNHKIFLISRDQQRLNDLINYCKTNLSKSVLIALPFDLEKIEDIKTLVAKITSDIDVVDIVINNAGYLVNKPFESMLIEDVEQIYKVNVLAPIELIKCLIPSLKKSKQSHVINISSMGGFQGSVKFAGLAAYSSSKAALASLTECLAEEFKESNIKFNCLALGAVATEMLAEAFPGYEAPTSAMEMAQFIYEFALSGHNMFNGKILPISKSTP